MVELAPPHPPPVPHVTAWQEQVADVHTTVGGWKGMRKRLLAFSILGALVLCASMMTCPVFALTLIVLGYAQHDRIISILGTLLLPVALFMFTRQLELGLMNTGILLMVQALVLLAVFCGVLWAVRSFRSNSRSMSKSKFAVQKGCSMAAHAA